MVTVIKIFVKIIKLFIVFDKSSNGALSQWIEELESKYGTEN